MAVAEKSKESELRSEVSELKGKLSNAENANTSLSRDLASARKAQEAAEQAAAEAKTLKLTLADRESQISRLQADLNSANAGIARANVVLDGLRAFKSVLDSA